MTKEIVTVLGAIGVALITGFFGWLTYRQGGRAQARQAEADQGAQRSAEWVALFDEVKETATAARAHAREAQTEAAACSAKVRELERLNHQLERRVADWERRYRTAVKHIRALRIYLAQNLPGHSLPAIPQDLQVDVDGGLD